ncbi:MAG: glycosyltransferase family 39 protein, partial [Nitrospirae bacterium]|nr:glycosyltransferase family 39 protein [Nitrospirota bacterium]
MDKPGAETTKPAGRWKQGIWIVSILAVCALLRLYILSVDAMPMLYGDSGTYLHMARVLAPNWDRPIGYSLFLAAVFAVTDKLQAVSVAQALLGVATTYLWYRLALERIGRAGAVAVALLVGLNLQAVVMEHYLLSEAFSVFLVSVFFYLLWRWHREPHWILSALAAVATVALGLTRTAFLIVLLLPPAVWVLTWRQGKAAIGRVVRQAVLFAGIVGFLLGGYALWMGSYFGPARITLFDGWALYQLVGKWTDCSGEKNRVTDALCRAGNPADNSRQQWKDIIWDPAGPALFLLRENNGSHAKTNDDLRRAALEIIWADPARYLKKVGRNVVQMATGGDFYWTRVSSESTAMQSGVQDELQRRFGGRPETIGYR